MTEAGFGDRLAGLERRLAAAESALAAAQVETAAVRRELEDLRGVGHVPAAEPPPTESPGQRPPGEEPAPARRLRAGAAADALAAALAALEAGNHGAVVFELERALREVRASGHDDPDARAEIRRLATKAGSASPTHRIWAADVAARASHERGPAADVAQPPPRVARTTEVSVAPRPERSPSAYDRLLARAEAALGGGEGRPPLADRLVAAARAWLTGARLLALGGAFVSLLGVVLVFALAVDRGWLGETGRVLIGAAVSAGFVAAGFVLRSRGRNELAVTAAAATGIAGGFVTLYVATAPYDLVPDTVAPFALAAISAAAIALSLFWSVQFLAVFGLLGAMLGPVLVRGEVDEPALAFAHVAFAVALVLAWMRRWQPLLAAGGTVGAALTGFFALEADGGAAYVALLVVAAALVYVTAVACTVRLWPPSGPRIALLVLLPLIAASYLHDGPAPWLLTGAAIAAAAAALTARRLGQRALAATTAAVVGVLGVLATAAVVGERSTTVAWAVEGVALIALLVRLRHVALLLAGLGYLAVAGAVLLVQEIEHVVGDSGGTQSIVRLSVFAACAGVVAALLVVAGRLPPTGDGVLGWVGSVLDRRRLAVQLSVRGASAVALASALSVGLDGLALALAAAAAAAVVLASNAWRQELDLDAIGAFLLVLSYAAFLSDTGPVTPAVWAGIAAGMSALTLARPLSERTSIAAYSSLGLAVAGLLVLDHDGLVRVERGSTSNAIAWLVLAGAAALAFEIDKRLNPGRESSVRREGATATPFLAGLALAAALVLLLGGLPLVVLLAAAAVGTAAAGRFGRRPELGLAGVASLAYPLYATGVGLDGSMRISVGLTLTALAALSVAELEIADRSLDGSPLADLPASVVAAPRLAALLGVQAFACVVGTVALSVAVSDDRWRAAATAATAALVALGMRLAAGWRTTLQVALAALVVLAIGETLEVARPLLLFRRVAPEAGQVGVAAALAGSLLVVAAGARLNASAFAADVRDGVRRVTAIVAGTATLLAGSLAVRAVVPELGGGADAQFQRSQTAVSILWALTAIGLLFAGLARRERLLRLGGFVLLGIAVAKIFLFDLDQLSSLARALSFLGVGVLILVGGWLVQRYAERAEGGGDAS